MKHKRWGQRKLSDEAIRQIAAMLKMLPRCEKTYREVGVQFHVGPGLISNIALGWITPRGTDPPAQASLLKSPFDHTE